MNILIYTIEGQQYGLSLNVVKSAALAVEYVPIPNSPEYILGAINVRGHITTVINMRMLFGWPVREISTSDQFVLCEFNQKHMALWVDSIKGVKLIKEQELIPAQEILPDLEDLQYVLKENDQIILLYDIEKLLESRHEYCH